MITEQINAESHPSVFALRDEMDIEDIGDFDFDEGEWCNDYSVRYPNGEVVVQIYYNPETEESFHEFM